jgi:hypothetical protein
MMTRTALKERSNNRINPNQNVCAHYVAKALGVDGMVRYLHWYSDVLRAIRKKFDVRSVKSKMKATVGASRAVMVKLAEIDDTIIGFVVQVDGHVLLINNKGKTKVDTAPRVSDRRKIIAIHTIRRNIY